MWGNSQNGIHMNADASLGGDGIISDALVEENVLYDNGATGGSAINCDGVQDSRIQNNLVYDHHSSGISLYMIDGGAASAAGNNRSSHSSTRAALARKYSLTAAAAAPLEGDGFVKILSFFFNLRPGLRRGLRGRG